MNRWLPPILRALAAIALVLGLVNSIVHNGAWGVAWTALALAFYAHARIESIERPSPGDQAGAQK